MTTDVIASNVSPGDDTLAGIFNGIASSVQGFTNQWAALRAQNDDITAGRWTLNNAAFHFNEMPPVSRALIVAGLAYVAVHLFKGA